MDDSTLPPLVTPTSETALPVEPNTTATEPPVPLQRCHLQYDAWEESLMNLKKAALLVQERKRTYDECIMKGNQTWTGALMKQVYSDAAHVNILIVGLVSKINTILEIDD